MDLESPRAIQRLSLRVFDGVLDPSNFQLQGLEDDDDEESWMTIFKVEEEKGGEFLFITAPAHPHATSVAVYPALLPFSLVESLHKIPCDLGRR